MASDDLSKAKVRPTGSAPDVTNSPVVLVVSILIALVLVVWAITSLNSRPTGTPASENVQSPAINKPVAGA